MKRKRKLTEEDKLIAIELLRGISYCLNESEKVGYLAFWINYFRNEK